MSDKPYNRPSDSEKLSAKDLRARISEKQFEEATKAATKTRAEDEEKRKTYLEFMERVFTEEDRLRLRRKGERAVEQQLYEIELLKFPSEYLEDHGRRINNNADNWPDSLTGYAKSVHDAYVDLARPEGYKLLARVLDYPGGMIGDIGLYMSWK